MAMVDEKQRNELIERALNAFRSADDAKANDVYREIVQSLTQLCNKNQKEIAQELQIMAKMLETQGKSEESFDFKQKTCAVMLELNMEERRKQRVHGTGPLQQPAGNSSEAEQQPAPVAQTPVASQPEAPAAVAPTATANSSDNRPQRTKIIGTPSQSSLIPHPDLAAGNANDASADGPTEATESDTTDTELPFHRLAYLYMGTKDYQKTVSFYEEVLKAEQIWSFDRFGSRITAFRLSSGPEVLIADHRKGPSCQPVFEVGDLTTTARELTERGWKSLSGPFGTPNGEAYSFEDPSGNKLAIFERDATSTDRSYFDPTEY